jgi:hypothetical protein
MSSAAAPAKSSVVPRKSIKVTTALEGNLHDYKPYCVEFLEKHPSSILKAALHAINCHTADMFLIMLTILSDKYGHDFDEMLQCIKVDERWLNALGHPLIKSMSYFDQEDLENVVAANEAAIAAKAGAVAGVKTPPPTTVEELEAAEPSVKVKKSRKAAAVVAAEVEVAAEEAPKPAKKSSSKKKAAEPVAEVEEVAEEAPKPAKKSSSKKKAAEAAEVAVEVEEAAEEAPKPAKKSSKKKAVAAEPASEAEADASANFLAALEEQRARAAAAAEEAVAAEESPKPAKKSASKKKAAAAAEPAPEIDELVAAVSGISLDAEEEAPPAPKPTKKVISKKPAKA